MAAGGIMRRTIYIPDDLAWHVETYLRHHPRTSLSTLIQEALREKLIPRDPRGILKLAGLVPEASTQAGQHAEDQFVRRER
jgi:metal-responsive CopG/Arc/MetJ family transcriptional regulator